MKSAFHPLENRKVQKAFRSAERGPIPFASFVNHSTTLSLPHKGHAGDRLWCAKSPLVKRSGTTAHSPQSVAIRQLGSARLGKEKEDLTGFGNLSGLLSWFEFHPACSVCDIGAKSMHSMLEVISLPAESHG